MDCSVLRLFDFDLLVDFDRFRRCLLRPKGPREFTLPESESDSELELDEYIATVPAAAEETPTNGCAYKPERNGFNTDCRGPYSSISMIRNHS